MTIDEDMFARVGCEHWGCQTGADLAVKGGNMTLRLMTFRLMSVCLTDGLPNRQFA